MIGADTPLSPYAYRSVIGEPETSAYGNVILRVGRQHDNGPTDPTARALAIDADTVTVTGWEQTEYVVLTPADARRLIDALHRALNPDLADAIDLATARVLAGDACRFCGIPHHDGRRACACPD
jgi:hypothetical protein